MPRNIPKPKPTPRPTASKPTVVVPACPSCSGQLEKVGTIERKDLLLCHNERKAFKGGQDPPVEAHADKTRHPSLYDAVVQKHETTINIEDIILD